MKTKRTSERHYGFTIVEILFVIAVVGVLCAIAIPVLGNINERARISQVRAQARSVAEVFNAAKAAGAALPGENVAELLDSISTGSEGKGLLSTSRFGVFLSLETREEIQPYLEFKEGTLIYDGTAEK